MHIPVLLNEVLEYFEPISGKKIIDATANGGGHTLSLRKKGADVLPIEWDPGLAKEIGAVNDTYVNLEAIADKHEFSKCDGVLFDLGFSSRHLESGRGFSFEKDEPLDMRYNSSSQTAVEIINLYTESELERILREYGEERFSKGIARSIVESRRKERIITTKQLVHVILGGIPAAYRHKRIHAATRTFQALRIEANSELENLRLGLLASLSVLKVGGRVIVISFHSLEDKIVKDFFKKMKMESKLQIITKKPIMAQEDEISINPRSRSAKLRVAEKITHI